MMTTNVFGITANTGECEYEGHKTTLARCMFLRNVHLIVLLISTSRLTWRSPLGVVTPVGVYQSHSIRTCRNVSGHPGYSACSIIE